MHIDQPPNLLLTLRPHTLKPPKPNLFINLIVNLDFFESFRGGCSIFASSLIRRCSGATAVDTVCDAASTTSSLACKSRVTSGSGTGSPTASSERSSIGHCEYEEVGGLVKSWTASWWCRERARAKTRKDGCCVSAGLKRNEERDASRRKKKVFYN